MKHRSLFNHLSAGVSYMAPAALLALSACLNLDTDTAPSSTCSTGSAAIAITDGQLAILCGCDEPGGQWAANGADLTCTVPAGSTVFFHYLNSNLRHQIVSAPGSAETFPASSVYDPSRPPAVRAHSVRLDTLGTYEFTDEFDSSLNAQLVAR